MRQKSETPNRSSEQVVKDIRRATRKHYSAEEKIKAIEERGYKAEFERTLVRECEDLLVMQWNLPEKLLQQLRSMR